MPEQGRAQLDAGEATHRRGLERLVDAALEMIQEGDCLKLFGTTRESLSERAGVSGTTFDYWFHPSGKHKLRLGDQIARRVAQTVKHHSVSNAEQYEMAAQYLTDMRSSPEIARMARLLVKNALMRDLGDFAAFDRLYLLVAAVADQPDTQHAQILRDALTAGQKSYSRLYELFCGVTDREFSAGGLERTQRAVNSYLEGVVLLRRYGAEPDDDEVVDTVMQLFWATTKPAGGTDFDAGEALFAPDHA